MGRRLPRRRYSGIPFQTDQLEQAHLGYHKALPSACDHQAGNDGQGERDLELDGGAFAGPAEDIHDAADFLDVGLHHVQADPAPRNIGYRLRRRQAGLEDQVQRLAITQLLRLFGP